MIYFNECDQYNFSDLDSLVLNYLVVEGYKEAAQVFQQESGLKNDGRYN